MGFIPYGRQDISQEDINAVVEVLTSDYLTQGPKVPEFEDCVARYVGVTDAIAVNSATSALHIACMALGLGEGDWLWTSPNTFVASANCGLYCGANISFVDINPQTYNMDADALRKKLSKAKIEGTLPKVVVPVAFAGQSCDMKGIHELSLEYGFKIIEDASHAIGGNYLDKKIGASIYSDITIFSFHPVKIVTTAEGGMALTNDKQLADKMRLARSHGITRDTQTMTQEPDGPWYYQQTELGLNYRMTEMQAALGISQMKRIDGFVARRHQLANRYDQLLAGLPLRTPYQSSDSYSGYHLYPIVLDNKEKRLAVFNAMRAANIGVNVHYIPVHTQPYYLALGHKIGDYPQSELYYSGAISLPMYATLSDLEQDFVVKTLKEQL
ncbi:UDP-4-amino-4,6-dideoxy-N-acetyl-beta-L-altrosamine transaminase [Serratia fonticola]|uniref:UDP-4-amino-4, 6-dideoxy-N-acetyl-beta-L-altrosamine transaminase n=1 Tax=Serratia fonticola TaxID=47917 RepID=UPI001C46CD21|nr:UDP-4-amino-4,6-dideoxy-N-acetyl-beta-L-altrosamine transaminase [Serratia fonticola]QXN62377.1 UDP-4-amino-4,6-dideoxy-N-acetyl-beta-L-altrosamine transaminase [Serratia fonticola]